MKKLMTMAIATATALALWMPVSAQAKDLAAMKADYQRPSEVPHPEENPYSDQKAELGKMLFFDPRLSGNNHFTCAMCHNPSMGWEDGLALGFGEGMKHLGRSTPTILNLAWSEIFMWDGRFGSLEEQALGPIGAAVEMNQNMKELVPELQRIPGYVTQFNIAFPGEGISLTNIAKAIATYERTIVSALAPFDLWVGGDENAISESAKRGFALYNTKARCNACHSGWNFTDDSFHDIGLPPTKDRKHIHASDHLASTNDHGKEVIHIHQEDKGRGDLDDFKNIVKMQYAFKTPGLRNLPSRAPFMHDGRLKTLMDVINHYNTGGIKRPSLSDEMKPLNLTEAEKKDLEAFMLTLVSNDKPQELPNLPY